MAMFYVSFEVRPTQQNSQVELVAGALAHCWVLGDSAVAAYNKAWFWVWRDEWEITDSTVAIEVAQEHFEQTDLGLAQFAKALEESVAIYYAAWSRDGQTMVEPFLVQRSADFDQNVLVQAQKALAAKGRCLHFESGDRCNQFAEAHSLQKEGLLREISRNGEVYAPSLNVGKIKRNQGKISLEKRGIGKVSTFLGFCRRHDSDLFKPIDTAVLKPTDEQVALYAYRTLCREVFTKENSAALIEEQIARGLQDRGERMLFNSRRTGTAFGLENVRRHKKHFDEMLRDGSYQDVEYTLFTFRQKPFLAFSAAFYPEFDFLGRKLQNLADHSGQLDLMTFCSASMQDGWGFLFAWHKTSATTCREFLSSLANVIHGGRSGETALFRMAVSNCENLAFAPDWWEAQSENEQRKICSALSIDPFAPTSPDYLTTGLEGIGNWEFDGVFSGNG